MTVFGTDLVIVSAVFNISIFLSTFYICFCIFWLYFIIVCERARWSAGALGDRARCKARDAVATSEM